MDLINWETKAWKTSMVQDLFGAETAYGICQIPLGTIHNEDRQIWRNTTNGEFTVRSAYHLQNEILAFD